MAAHRALALAALTVALLNGGCTNSHMGGGSEGADGGGTVADGGRTIADGGAATDGDAGRRTVAPDAGRRRVDAGSHRADGGRVHACSRGGGDIRVDIAPITARPVRCDAEALADSVLLYDVKALDTGVRLELDVCPGADDDCRCAVEVKGVGADLAEHIDPHATGTFVHVQYAGDRALLVLESVPCEPCLPGGDPCPPCHMPVVLFAADGPLDDTALTPGAVDFAPGTRTCTADRPSDDDCIHLRRTIRATEDVGDTPVEPATVEVDEGETAMLPGTALHVRAIRTHHFECKTAFVQPEAAWVAWDG